MRQVPENLILGRGQVGQHFTTYFKSLGLSVENISSKSFTKESLQAQRIFLAIPDSHIEEFFQKNLLSHTEVYHFSGALSFEKILGVHPLQTFRLETYEDYDSIPLVFDHKAKAFWQNFKNPKYEISRQQKAKYHALCVMAGNFPQILWQKVFSEFQNLGLPKHSLRTYLTTVVKNALEQEEFLTGPLKRKDFQTIETHLNALDTKDKKLYQCFLDYYQTKDEK